MAKGWESKSVEDQMETAQAAKASKPAAALNDDEKRVQRERDGLKLSRAYVLHQIESSTNERYTESLQTALNEIDRKLADLEKLG